MTIVIQSDQTPGKKLVPVLVQNFQEHGPDGLGDRALDPQLNNTGKACTPEGEHAGKVQILCDDDRAVIAGVIKDRVVGVAEVTDVRPMGGGDSVRSEVTAPAWREIFVENQIHDASS